MNFVLRSKSFSLCFSSILVLCSVAKCWSHALIASLTLIQSLYFFCWLKVSRFKNKFKILYFSDSNSICSFRGTMKRFNRLSMICLVGFHKILWFCSARFSCKVISPSHLPWSVAMVSLANFIFPSIKLLASMPPSRGFY